MNLQVAFGHPMATAPLDWASERIRAAREVGVIPDYGSTEWAELAARDPRRWASVIRAAEAWRDYRSPERAALDYRDEEDEFIRRMRSASVDVSTSTNWAAIASEPSHAELARRRAL